MEETRRALNTYTKLMRAAESVTARVQKAIAPFDLTVSQFGVLEALYHKGPLCQRDIAAKILKSTGNITMVIDNLEKRGLVQRVRDNEDRRFLTVYLTDAGTEIIADAFSKMQAAITEDLSILNADEQEELGVLCKMLGRGCRRC